MRNFLSLKRLTVAILISLILAPPHLSKAEESKEHVVILHGIMKSSRHMKELAQYLKNRNYNVLNLDYPSTKYDIKELISLKGLDIKSRIRDNQKVHFIGYSMGGLLTRGILNDPKLRPKNLGNVVLIGTPNKGSEVANFWKGTWIFSKLFGPAGQQLTTDAVEKELQKILGKPNYNLGIIAGSFTIDLFSSMLIKGTDDGKVSVESTKIDGMDDFIKISASHTFMPSNNEVIRQTYHFLQNGKFKRLNKK